MSFKSLKTQSSNHRSAKEQNRKLEPVARCCSAVSLDNSVDRFWQLPHEFVNLASPRLFKTSYNSEARRKLV